MAAVTPAPAGDDPQSPLNLRSQSVPGSPRHMLRALAAAASEAGCPTAGLTVAGHEFPAGVAAHWSLPPFAEHNRGRVAQQPPPSVYVDLRAPRRKALDEMIEATAAAGGHDWYRPTVPGAIHGPMLDHWDEIRSTGPRLTGLADRLKERTDTGDGLGEHPVAWFRRIATEALTVAYFAGVPVNLCGCAVLDSGSSVTIYADGPGCDVESPPGIGVAEGDTVGQIIDNAVEAILYAHGYTSSDDGYDTKAAPMRAAMAAASVEIPDTPAALYP